jgi:hypothetical protein
MRDDRDAWRVPVCGVRADGAVVPFARDRRHDTQRRHPDDATLLVRNERKIVTTLVPSTSFTGSCALRERRGGAVHDAARYH